MNVQVTSSPDRRQRRARARLIAWAGMLAMVLQLAAPLMGAAAARAFSDEDAGEAFTAVICSSVAGTAHRSGGQDIPDDPSKDSLPCTLCFVCQAASLGAKLTASAPVLALAVRPRISIDTAQAEFTETGRDGQRPPSRAPPFIV
jgi:hypothetical protein